MEKNVVRSGKFVKIIGIVTVVIFLLVSIFFSIKEAFAMFNHDEKWKIPHLPLYRYIQIKGADKEFGSIFPK